MRMTLVSSSSNGQTQSCTEIPVGVGNAAGYGFMLILVAFFRELFGSGKLYGYQIIPESLYEMGYVNNGFMLLSPMALITVGVIIWIQRARNRKLIEKG